MISWILYSFFAYAFAAAANISDKYVVDKHIKDSLIIALFSGAVACLVGLGIFVVRGFPILPVFQMSIVLVAGILLELYLIPYFYALERADASSVIPQFQMVPIFVLLLSYFFLHEMLITPQIIGFVVIFISSLAFLFSYEVSMKTMIQVFWSMILSSSLFASSVVLFKFVVGLGNVWDSIAYEGIGMGIGTLLIFLYPGHFKRFLYHAKELQPVGWLALSSSEFFVVLYRVLFSLALSLGSASLINVLSGLQPVFVLIFGILLSYFFPNIVSEKVDKKTIFVKVLSLLGVFIGLFFIYQV